MIWILIGILIVGVILIRAANPSKPFFEFKRNDSFFVTFKQKWPAISDDEFLQRCSPGTSKETAIKVRAIVSEQLGVPYDHIYPEQSFVDDLGCD